MRHLGKIRTNLVVGVFTVLASATLASAAVPWSVPSGSQVLFNYSNGQSVNGKFGDGNEHANQNGFTFFPSQFVASANGTNTPVTVTDTTSVTINASSVFLSVTASFMGDYTILGGGSATASGLLKATNLDTLAVASAPMVVAGVPVIVNNSAQGGVFGTQTVNLPGGWLNFKLEFTSTITATASSNGVALIENKGADLVIRQKLIPEPTGLAAFGLLGALVRRSRK